MGPFLLTFVVLLPFVVALAVAVLVPRRPALALRLSLAAAMLLTLAVSLALEAVDVSLPLPGQRALVLSAIAQLGIQLLSLGMLGLVLLLLSEPDELVVRWLPLAWVSLGALTLALLMSSLPLALLLFVAGAMVWTFGAPPAPAGSPPSAALRYAVLVTLATPLLLVAFRLAEERTAITPDLERLVLALAVPGFGLVLGLFPLHAWSLTLAAGTPRTMLFGVLALVQTAGFALLLRTLAGYPWLTAGARGPLLAAATLSAVLGGWLALSARDDDPDDWLVYAAIANAGMLLAGLAAQSQAAGVGAVLLLFARVLALLVVALAPQAAGVSERVAALAGTLALAGTPGLAGFPGLWLVLRALLQTSGRGAPLGNRLAALGLLVGSGLLFAAAVRRWSAGRLAADDEPARAPAAGARRTVLFLVALLVLLGVAPAVIAPAFAGSLQEMFFPLP
jgi:formate hydrogenlyase subunit 3/multisubunit Na+/H+ antiporter MnhD subunit